MSSDPANVTLVDSKFHHCGATEKKGTAKRLK